MLTGPNVLLFHFIPLGISLCTMSSYCSDVAVNVGYESGPPTHKKAQMKPTKTQNQPSKQTPPRSHKMQLIQAT